jgi:RNA polymerase sigma-70 factor (ECF subfamily)
MTHADEAALVERAKHDPSAFAALYDRYVERIYAYVARQVEETAAAQDVTAATFEKALRHIRRYRPAETGLAPWLYTIARHEIAQHYRRGRFVTPWRGRGEDEADEVDEPVMPGTAAGRPIESLLLAGERDGALHAALSRLSPADRDLLTLRFLEELPTADVAAILGCSRANVYVRLHRALARLRGQLERAAAAKEMTP